MVVEVERDIRDTVREYVDAGMDDGLTLPVAAEQAVERLIADGLAERVLRAIGPQAVSDIWRHHQHEARDRAAEGPRRVDVAALQDGDSLLEALYPVGGGRWLPLGDFRAAECRAVATDYAKQAATMQKKERAFLRLEESLEGEQTVRQRYTDETLRKLFEG